MVSTVLLQAFLNDEISFTECLEILAVACGLKKIARFTGNRQRLHALEALMGLLRMHCAIAPFHLEPVFSGALGDHFGRVAQGEPQGEKEGALFAGPQALIEAAANMELHGCDAEEAAELYGYPLCCARNYERAIQHGAYWADSFLAGTRGTTRAPWLMNRFGRLFAPYLSLLPDYFPCHITCAPSLALAQEYLTMLEQEALGVLAEHAKIHLARTVLRHGGCLYQVSRPEGKNKETAVTVLAAWPYAGQALDATVLLLRLEGKEISVSIPGKTSSAGETDRAAVCLIFE